jgi:hypothetical protein
MDKGESTPILQLLRLRLTWPDLAAALSACGCFCLGFGVVHLLGIVQQWPVLS